MPRSQVADRYAKALFELAREKGEIREIEDWLGGLGRLWRESRDFRVAMKSPLVSPEEKTRVLTRLLGPDAPKLLKPFFGVLIAEERLGLWPEIAERFQELAEEYRSELTARVEAALELTDEERQQLADVLSRRFGRRVLLETRVNPDVLGGVRVWAGDRLLDGSLAGQLRAVAERLKGLEIQETGGR